MFCLDIRQPSHYFDRIADRFFESADSTKTGAMDVSDLIESAASSEAGGFCPAHHYMQVGVSRKGDRHRSHEHVGVSQTNPRSRARLIRSLTWFTSTSSDCEMQEVA